MLTRTTRIQLVAFAVIAVVVLAYTGFHYAGLGRLIGLRGYYTVQMDLSNAGGIFPNGDVTYRGVSVGRVGTLQLTPAGVVADLNISSSAPPIPARLHAVVADLSAVGEEYVDLRPLTTEGPYLAQGSVIPRQATQIPLPVTSVLNSVNTLATSLPLASLRVVLNELATGFADQGVNIQQLIDGQSKLVRAANSTISQSIMLTEDSQVVLATQNAESAAFTSFASSLRLFAGQLAASDSDLRRLVANGPAAATQVAGLITDISPSLGALIANLLTISEVSLTRGSNIEELLSALPAAIAAGSTVITRNGAKFGVALTFFNPLPCTAGYQGTKIRNGLDTSPGPPLNTKARCTSPPSSGIGVRGSANAPSGGGVPPAAAPGMAGLLGVTP
jgi:phospholipid/cholesterol/gamma-HCH transport system substrate-binding protein